MSSELMQFFAYDHLPISLQTVSKSFYELAKRAEAVLPDNAERQMCLRKLLEGKDCAVRSIIMGTKP